MVRWRVVSDGERVWIPCTQEVMENILERWGRWRVVSDGEWNVG